MQKKSKSKSKSNSNAKKKRASRSLRIVSRKSMMRVYNALDKKGWKQYSIISEVDVSPTTLDVFFAGKGINRDTFIEICQVLGLRPEEIYEPEQIIEAPRKAVPYYASKKRIKQMNDLVELQEKSNGIAISIPDMGGQGKTEFVLKFIEEKVAKDKTRFSGGCVFVDTNQNIFQQIDRFFRRVATENPSNPEWNMPPSNPADQRNAVQDWYNEYESKYPSKPFPVLFVFDDVQSLEQIEGYLPTRYREQFSVLITTRKQMLSLSYDVFHIAPFTETDSIELFSQIIKPTSIIDELRAEFNELAFLVEYLPLAIEIESKLIRTRMVGKKLIDHPDFIPVIRRKLLDLIETLKQPCEVPISLKSIGTGLGLTTELNTDPTRRKELKENGIVALFLYTWNLFLEEEKQVAYAASLFEAAPIDINCLNNWLSLSHDNSVEDIIFDKLADYSFCKVNNRDEIEIHKLIKRFVLEQRTNIENIEKTEEHIAVALRDSIGTYTNEYTEVAHFTDISAIQLDEYFCSSNSNTNPWQYISGSERLIETALITRISSTYNQFNEIAEKAHILSEKIKSRINKETNLVDVAYSLIDLNILYFGIGAFKASIEVLEHADTLLSAEEGVDGLKAIVHRELGLAVKLSATTKSGKSKSYSLRGLDTPLSVFEKAYFEFFRAIDLLTENDEMYWMLHNDVAGLFLDIGRVKEALVFAEIAYDGILELKTQKSEVTFSDIQVLGIVYLYFDRFADARRIFRDYMNEKENPMKGSTSAEKVLTIGRTFYMAGKCIKDITNRRKYFLMARRYLIIGTREHENSMGRQSRFYLSAIRQLKELDRLIPIADQRIKKVIKRKAMLEKARKKPQ